MSPLGLIFIPDEAHSSHHVQVCGDPDPGGPGNPDCPHSGRAYVLTTEVPFQVSSATSATDSL